MASGGSTCDEQDRHREIDRRFGGPSQAPEPSPGEQNRQPLDDGDHDVARRRDEQPDRRTDDRASTDPSSARLPSRWLEKSDENNAAVITITVPSRQSVASQTAEAIENTGRGRSAARATRSGSIVAHRRCGFRVQEGIVRAKLVEPRRQARPPLCLGHHAQPHDPCAIIVKAHGGKLRRGGCRDQRQQFEQHPTRGGPATRRSVRRSIPTLCRPRSYRAPGYRAAEYPWPTRSPVRAMSRSGRDSGRQDPRVPRRGGHPWSVTQ